MTMVEGVDVNVTPGIWAKFPIDENPWENERPTIWPSVPLEADLELHRQELEGREHFGLSDQVPPESTVVPELWIHPVDNLDDIETVRQEILSRGTSRQSSQVDDNRSLLTWATTPPPAEHHPIANHNSDVYDTITGTATTSTTKSIDSADIFIHPYLIDEAWQCFRKCTCPLRPLLIDLDIISRDEDILDVIGLMYRVALLLKTSPHGSFEKLVKSLNPDSASLLQNVLHVVLKNAPNTKLLGLEELDRLRRCMRLLAREKSSIPSALFFEDIEPESPFPRCGGGFCDIYVGYTKGASHSRIQVALKAGRASTTTSAQELMHMYKELCQEVFHWQYFDHPHLIPFLGLCKLSKSDMRLCMVTPWFNEGNIIEYLKRSEASSRGKEVDRYRLMCQAASGIEYLHDFYPGLIHGDIKGANILIDENGNVKVSDFGLIKISGSQRAATTFASRNQHGSLRWMSPELLNDHEGKKTYSSDCYALGMTILEVFTLNPPYHHISNDTAVMNTISNNKLPKREGQFMDSLWNLMCRCWKGDPDSRPNAKEIREELGYCMDARDAPPGVNVDKRWTRQRGPNHEPTAIPPFSRSLSSGDEPKIPPYEEACPELTDGVTDSDGPPLPELHQQFAANPNRITRYVEGVKFISSQAGLKPSFQREVDNALGALSAEWKTCLDRNSRLWFYNTGSLLYQNVDPRLSSSTTIFDIPLMTEYNLFRKLVFLRSREELTPTPGVFRIDIRSDSPYESVLMSIEQASLPKLRSGKVTVTIDGCVKGHPTAHYRLRQLVTSVSKVVLAFCDNLPGFPEKSGWWESRLPKQWKAIGRFIGFAILNNCLLSGCMSERILLGLLDPPSEKSRLGPRKKAIIAIRQGLQEIIPHKLLDIFYGWEFRLVLSGRDDINMLDWQNHTSYLNYTTTDSNVRLFWSCIQNWDDEWRRRLIEYVTGSRRVPFTGFRDLLWSGAIQQKPQKFIIAKTAQLSSSTQSCRLNLPVYNRKDRNLMDRDLKSGIEKQEKARALSFLL